MEILKAKAQDIDEILALQKLAFKQVAETLGNYNIEPLTQSKADIEKEFEKGVFLKCVCNGKICGSVRAYIDENLVCHIGKLIVLPDMQKNGIGKTLLLEIEKYFANAKKFALFTGQITQHTRRLYENLGYTVVREKEKDSVKMLFMEKQK
ncbi:MAG: GNAT family N-acetyltransferase [Opitutales bacterium]|nr:GNAT family N-acetyltransferase [Opitutales bacterium]